MKLEKGQATLDLALLLVLILVVVYIIWPWLNFTLLPWIVALLQGLISGNLTSWAWLILIVVVLALLGRRY